MSKLYVLDAENRPVRIHDLREWGQWFEHSSNRIVGMTQINSEVHVSTVFLGLDHRFGGNGPPLLFETMVFGGPMDQEQWRYSSWDDAAANHEMVVKRARAAMAGARA